MERRVFIAVLLSFVVLYTYQTYFSPPPPPTAGKAPASSSSASPSPSSSAPAAPSTGAPAEVSPAPAPSEPEAVSVLGDSQPREVTVETPTARIVFSNRGARVLHWQLKDYRDTVSAMVDMVPSEIPAGEPSPFSLVADDARDTARLNSALYKVTGDTNGVLDVTMTSEPLVFEFQDENGLTARKEFRFDAKSYTLAATISVRRGTTPLNPAIQWGPGLGDQGAASGGGSIFTGNAVSPPRVLLHRGGKVVRLTPDKAAETPMQQGPFRFVGVDDHYFVAFAVSDLNGAAEFKPLTLPGPNNTQRRLLSYTLKPAAPGQPVKFYVGPKQFDELQRLGPDYVRAIDFGMFAWIVVPLLGTLKWLYRFTGNYGWSIILLTIIINLVMFPLRHKSSVAMRRMQAIQPRMKEIQDRYSHLKMTDPGRQKMQEEVTALYKEKGVNPASGCVPMLITLPALWAFYSLLSQSVELRGAPFAAWIHDLSGNDPYFVLPALMGLTMFWQQKVTPTSADPAQQRVMMVMPVMFTAMMAFSASGVVLYWFVSQVWAIGQQYLTNWIVGPLPTVAKPAPAVRRAK
ncbi:MAG TPA: membrane protein insertase YidC [Vicinamibacterales bacterium]|jgi:YidC/Oxa1 family membrane protein insertase|nr:membrane protein insertase YidC [Vicinamibacterales bacterium]